MNTSGLMRYAGAVAALALCSACAGGAGGPAVAPSYGAQHVEYRNGRAFVDGRPVTAARPHLSALPRYAELVPDHLPTLTVKHFEYIINDYGTYASIFNYPKSINQIGSITNVGGQGCTHTLSGYGLKTFWIVAADNQITKFSAPKRPLRMLSDTVGMPSSCAMNAAGDLAVGILDPSQSYTVIIYKHAKAPYVGYATPLLEEYFDGYDSSGNLFADGFTRSGFGLAELPKGGKTFRTITTSNVVQFPGSVQWDGKYLVVTDQLANALYQYKVVGTQATLKGTVQLSGSSDCAQTWIVPQTSASGTGVVYCADAGTDDGEVFKYPAGGSPIAVFQGNFDLPLGTVAVEN
ncbi:MAG TPA: hypothetical protein VJP76_00590 [Candidatus Tumulicola sp.]|nr:hypothetical protein [Candidatus Tumulicola sp.]